MNKLFLITVFVFSLYSCNQQKKIDENKEESKLNDAISKAEKSKIIETKTFLGFEFGMSEKEVHDYILKLQKEGKVYINNNNDFQYDFSFNSMNIFLNFIPEYYDGKLYKMIYTASTELGGIDTHVFLMNAFKDTKSGFETHINEDLLGDTYYTNIKDNLIITFMDSRMIYENAPISKLAKQREEKINKEKSKKSNSEF